MSWILLPTLLKSVMTEADMKSKTKITLNTSFYVVLYTVICKDKYVDNDKTYLCTLSHDKIVFIKFFVVKIGFFTNETYKMKRNDALLL